MLGKLIADSVICFDTETTGIRVEDGHRVIEVGMVELVDRKPTGKTLQFYCNPEREIESDAIAIHGITNEVVSQAALFKDKIEEMIAFIDGRPLVAHNAAFDIGHFRNEFGLAGDDFDAYGFEVIDTLQLARELLPGSRHSLDALCDRYNVSREHRTHHGALLDSELLASVYLAMTTHQSDLSLDADSQDSGNNFRASNSNLAVRYATNDELAAHAETLSRVRG